MALYTFCENCGTKNNINSNYCTKCGTKLNNEVSEIVAAEERKKQNEFTYQNPSFNTNEVTATHESNTSKGMTFRLGAVGCLGVLLIAVIIGFIVAFGNKQETKPMDDGWKNGLTEYDIQNLKWNLFPSLSDFRTHFNRVSRNNNLGLEIERNLHTETGSVNNSFQYMFNQRIGLIGALKKSDNSVISVAMIAESRGTNLHLDDVLVCMACLEGAIDPSLSKSQKQEIINSLGVFSEKPSGYIKINGIKWYANMIGGFLYFGAELPQY